MLLNKEDTVAFQKWLKEHLAGGVVSVLFTKKDGTERVMKCTTSESLVPVIVESTEPKREKKVNEDVMNVYDVDAKGWRSFRWDSVKNVVIDIE
jgi:hypothetical protein